MAIDRRPPPGRDRRHLRLGPLPLPVRQLRAGRIRRDPPLRPRRPPARACIPTGGAWCSTSGGTRSGASWPRRPTTGCARTTPTGCGSTPWPRCSTSTTPAGPASGFPTQYGGREDLDAVAFLRQLNSGIYADHPDVQTMAEESTAWPGVSRPVEPRWPRVRAEVGHGLDARHAPVLLRGSDPPAVPPRRADLPLGLRLHRELRPAALPR